MLAFQRRGFFCALRSFGRNMGKFRQKYGRQKYEEGKHFPTTHLFADS